MDTDTKNQNGVKKWLIVVAQGADIVMDGATAAIIVQRLRSEQRKVLNTTSGFFNRRKTPWQIASVLIARKLDITSEVAKQRLLTRLSLI